MALKTIKQNGKDTGKPKAGSSNIPVVRIEGAHVAKFIKAKEDKARAESDIAEVEPILKAAGAQEVFAINCGVHTNEAKSVKLMDTLGATVRVTLAAQYPAADETVLSGLFEELGVDVNDYAFQTRKASFDSAVFVKDDKFNEVAYKAFFTACEDVARRLGVANPLSTTIVTTVKPDFDQKRYEAFDLQAQLRIYEAVPNKTSLTPVVG